MIVYVDDLRERARRRLPHAVFHFIDGAADDEWTLRENRAAFARIALRPRALVDVSARDPSVTLFGERLPSPLILAPVGMCGMAIANGEILAARAAAATGVVFTLAGMSLALVREVSRETSGANWLQIVVWKKRELTRRMVELARDRGYRALVVTVDVPVVGLRRRDVRHGAGIPPRITFRNALDMLLRWRWFLRVPRFTFADMETPVSLLRAGRRGRGGSVPRAMGEMIDPSVTWKEVAWLRSLWAGPLLVKGLMSGADAARAIDEGVDGIVVSNHGGRQLDGVPATIEVLPEVIHAVRGRGAVIVDGGIRRGTDVLKAIALGANACMVGRPYLWGLAADGQRGCELAIRILQAEIDRALALVGCPRLAEIDETYVRSKGTSTDGGFVRIDDGSPRQAARERVPLDAPPKTARTEKIDTPQRGR